MTESIATASELRAGPVRLTFKDGELRYLKVGDREIVRRIYFCIRQADWEPPMPQFELIELTRQDDSFEINMRATYGYDSACFRSEIRIAGNSDGTITFTVDGEVLADFESQRTGICVLYGSDSLAGRQRFSIVNEDGSTSESEFPELVSPGLVAEYHSSLSYETADGISVSCRLVDGLFQMEDQRNFGDSSYKAFTHNPYTSKELTKGQRGRQSVVLEVNTAAPPQVSTGEPVRIAVGAPDEAAVVPRIYPASESTPDAVFVAPNRNRDSHREAETVTFGFQPAGHLWDDDTLMENVTVLVPEVKTLRSFAPGARCRVDAITLEPAHPRPAADARNSAPFAGAWCARIVKYLALAGADEAVFCVDGAFAQRVLELAAETVGRPIAPTSVDPHGPIDAFAVEQPDGLRIWLINKTTQDQRVTIELSDSAAAAVCRIAQLVMPAGVRSATSAPATINESLPVHDGELALTLLPYEVCILTP
jgi:hypothetical protein